MNKRGVKQVLRFSAQQLVTRWLVGCVCGLALIASNAYAAPVVLEVIDAYAEVHSGPGRGYPVFYVIEQGEKIEILSRRPDWYEIRAKNGKVGWTTTAAISRTIQKTGEPADLPSVGYGDYIKGSFVTGFSTGQFLEGDLEEFDVFTVSGGYRFLAWLGADVEYGRLFGSGSAGDLYAANVFVEPAAHWKLSPFLSLGTGEISMDTQPDQINFDVESATFNTYGLGASYYLGRNFVIKGEYRWYSIDVDDETERFGTWKLGFNTFF
ncbi:hypothetical protein TDB9533_04203 [Thalassocella blandensis]|nr:hypothetical protein TDB9533_04203 [Thalassocella blandensis]